MKKLVFILGASSLLLLGACGDEEETAPDTPTQEEAEQADDISNNNEPGVTPVEQDITAKYLEMDEVAGARVGDRDGAIEARIMLAATLSEEEAIALGEEFAEELKEEYADKSVKVDVIQSGKKLKVIK